MNTTVISFRGHKSLKSWLELAGQGFDTEGELLKLLLSRAALEQAADTGVVGRVKGLLRRERAVTVGNTAVYAARLPVEIAALVRECAARQGKTASEWCALALREWWNQFHEGYEEIGGQVDFPGYATKYRALVEDLLTVYAQKATNK